jgi:SAM-dependent methyltransferase
VANEQQARFWQEEGGPAWVEDEESHDLMLEPFEVRLLAALDAQPGERVLDVGCGFGTTSLDVARAVAPDGKVVGVDLSEAMVGRARERAAVASATNVSFRCGDAQTDDLGRPFDAVVSRFGLMFFDDPATAFGNLAAATRPGGRLSFLCWRPMAENPWFAVPAAVVVASLPEPPPPSSPLEPGPFGLADATVVSGVLERAGWTDVSATPFDTAVRPDGGRGLDGAVEHVRKGRIGRMLAAQLPPDRAAEVLEHVRDALAPYERDGIVRLPGAAWCVAARRP